MKDDETKFENESLDASGAQPPVDTPGVRGATGSTRASEGVEWLLPLVVGLGVASAVGFIAGMSVRRRATRPAWFSVVVEGARPRLAWWGLVGGSLARLAAEHVVASLQQALREGAEAAGPEPAAGRASSASASNGHYQSSS